MMIEQWVIEPINNGETYQITTGENKGFGVVCETLGGTDWDKTNARLISAAPDLLAALEKVIDYHVKGINPLSDAAILSARAAISKARGEL